MPVTVRCDICGGRGFWGHATHREICVSCGGYGILEMPAQVVDCRGKCGARARATLIWHLAGDCSGDGMAHLDYDHWHGRCDFCHETWTKQGSAHGIPDYISYSTREVLRQAREEMRLR